VNGFQADWDLVQAELARLADPGPHGIDPVRAKVRAVCLHRLGIVHAAAVLRQEMLFTLAPEGVPWFDPALWDTAHTWATECNRMHFLAGVAGLVDFRLPMPDEMVRFVRNQRWRA
jgi:hypothetical protein